MKLNNKKIYSITKIYVRNKAFYLLISDSSCQISLLICVNPKNIGLKYSLIVLWGGGKNRPCLCFELLIGKQGKKIELTRY